MGIQPYLQKFCPAHSPFADSAVCSRESRQQLLRLTISTAKPQPDNQTLSLGLASDEGSSKMHRNGTDWVAAIAINQVYRLNWTNPPLGVMQFNAFPLAASSNVTLEMGLNPEAAFITIETGTQSLQLADQLPSNPSTTSAAYKNGVLSIVLNGSDLDQVQYKGSFKSFLPLFEAI